MTKLFSVRASTETERGLRPSPHPMDVALWRDGQNVIFFEGGPQKKAGWSTGFSISPAPSKKIRGMDTNESSSAVKRLFFGTAAKLYNWDGSTLTLDAAAYTGIEDQSSVAPATMWSFAPWGNWMAATNGVDAPQVWKGSSFAALGGRLHGLDTIEILVKRGRHLMAFNTSGSYAGCGINAVHWSDVDDIEDWVPTADNGARDQILREINGPIRSALLFGEDVAVLGENIFGLMNYVGSPFYFGWKPKLVGIGAVGKRATVVANNMMYGFSRSGIWECDKVGFKYIDTSAIREYIQDNLNTGQITKVVADYETNREGEVCFWFPGAGGENSFGVGFKPSNGSWTKYPFGRTAAVPITGVFPYPVRSDGTKVLFHDQGLNDEAGAAIDSWIRTRPLDMDAPYAWKYVDCVMSQLRRIAGAVQLRIGWSKDLDDAISWESYQTLDDGFEPAYFRSGGRFISLEWRSNAVGGDFALSGFDVFGEADGLEI